MAISRRNLDFSHRVIVALYALWIFQPFACVHQQKCLPQTRHSLIHSPEIYIILTAALNNSYGYQQDHLEPSTSLLENTTGTKVSISAYNEGPLFPESSCTYPSSDVNFEKVITRERLQDLLEKSGASISYRGMAAIADAATAIHKDISCAIQTNSLFKGFCNTQDKATAEENAFVNLSECLAFLAHAFVLTNSWTTFGESGTNRNCVESEKYPCGPDTAFYFARGPFQLRGNEDYGKLSEFLFGDASRLLSEPQQVEPQGIGGWAAALWKWMTDRPYGLNCPTTFAGSGVSSCHNAMVNQDAPAESAAEALKNDDKAALTKAVGGFGLTIHINGLTSTECCPSSLESLFREATRKEVAAAGGAAVAAANVMSVSGSNPILPGRSPQVTQTPAPATSQSDLFDQIMYGHSPSANPPGSDSGKITTNPRSEEVSPAALTPSLGMSAVAKSFPDRTALTSDSSTSSTVAFPAVATVGFPHFFTPSMASAAQGLPLYSPMSAAYLVSTFLSFLSHSLPLYSFTSNDSSDLFHPFGADAPPWTLPMPGATDGSCSTQAAITLKDLSEEVSNAAMARAAAAESSFCLSLLRGCPALFPASAAMFVPTSSSSSVDEDMAKAAAAAAQQQQGSGFSRKYLFKCINSSGLPAQLATGAAGALAAASTPLLPTAATANLQAEATKILLDGVPVGLSETFKPKLQVAAEQKEKAETNIVVKYLPTDAITCGFVTV